MTFNNKDVLKIAILDLYDGVENQGMRCIHQIIERFRKEHNLNTLIQIFNVRQKIELPPLDFDLYISTGGPGDPLESEGQEWDNKFFEWVEKIDAYNRSEKNYIKKPVFFICHSFQLACRYFKIGTLSKRKSNSFGVFPVHCLEDGLREPVFERLKNPFYAMDSRDYQVIEPNYDVIREMGSKLLAIEKERPHIPLQRAIMAVRFTEYFIGTQFHPEADPQGMIKWLEKPDKKKSVVKNHGLAKWQSMVDQLHDPDKLLYTQEVVLPNFLKLALTIKENAPLAVV